MDVEDEYGISLTDAEFVGIKPLTTYAGSYRNRGMVG